MKCNKAQEWISLQMDGQLSAERVSILNEHLGRCEACRIYCDDLMLGRRLFAATEPSPPDNFDWKLQLRLNQAMREVAREVSFPWPRTLTGWRLWFTRAGISAAVGLGAVLVFSLFLPARTMLFADHESRQVALTERDVRLPLKSLEQEPPPLDGSRRPLDSPYPSTAWPQRLSAQRHTSSGGGLYQKPWSLAGGDHDLVRIRRLEQDLHALRRLLLVRDRKIQLLEAKLDSLERLTVDRPME
jgi:hypothetical protein